MAERSFGGLVVAVVLVVCVVLAGCSSGGSPEDATTPASTDTGRTDGTTRATGAAGTANTASEAGGVAPIDEESRSALVTRVIDGDTVEVRYRNGTTDTVRLLGVDTPEVSGDVSTEEFEGIPDTEAGRDHLREWATRASSFARERLAGREVEVVTDPQADRRDRYGRLLAYVVSDGGEGNTGSGENGSFNAALLREGYARLYESSFTERERYERIESRAQEQGVGLWGFGEDGDGGGEETGTENGSPEPGLAIVRIEADAPGDDNENPNGEYVVFENRGSERLELGGWQVTDEGGHTYVVPGGVTLAPGARLTLYSGRGVDTESELYWGSSGAIWNNAGDAVIVRDASSTVVAERSYGPTR